MAEQSVGPQPRWLPLSNGQSIDAAMVNASVPAVRTDMPRLTYLTNRECHAAIRNMNACWTIHLFFKVMRFEDGCDRQS